MAGFLYRMALLSNVNSLFHSVNPMSIICYSLTFLEPAQLGQYVEQATGWKTEEAEFGS
jgi:hypothetical protein